VLRKQDTHWIRIAAIVMLFAAFPAQHLRAATLHVYDLDSLIYLSAYIVEGEIVRSYSAHQHDLVDIKISVVHKGELKSGRTVVVAHTDYYRKPKDDSFRNYQPDDSFRNYQPLAVGDRLVFFVVRGKRGDFFPIPDDAVIYVPLSGGVMLTVGEGVVGFAQRDSRGPYVANVPRENDKIKPLTLEHFRRQIRGGIQFVGEAAPILDAKKEMLDVRRLFKLLEERNNVKFMAPAAFSGRDHLAERACSRLTELEDPVVLATALPLVKDRYANWILQHGFGFPQGRDFLLGKVMDEKEAMESRLRHARALSNAGAVYCSKRTEITAHSHRDVGNADVGNSGYLTRIASAGLAQVKHEPLCRSLVSCVGWYGQGIVQNKPAPMMDDLRGALAVLKDIYDRKPSQELQFAVEIATVRVPDAYEKLQSPCGAVVSILRAADPTRYTRPEHRSLVFEYEYATVSIPREVELRPSVVLENEETKRKIVLPSSVQIRGWSMGGGSNSVVLPRDLPTGRYRVYFQFTDEDKVTSTGHYFTADL
jgi:hypothetical protein